MAKKLVDKITIHEFKQEFKGYFNNVMEVLNEAKEEIIRLVKENKELKAQIEKMKCCENCAWWYKLPNGKRDCAETCENLDNWSLRR